MTAHIHHLKLRLPDDVIYCTSCKKEWGLATARGWDNPPALSSLLGLAASVTQTQISYLSRGMPLTDA